VPFPSRVPARYSCCWGPISKQSSLLTLCSCSWWPFWQGRIQEGRSSHVKPTKVTLFTKNLFNSKNNIRYIEVVHKWCHTLLGGGGHQICDKGEGVGSSFVTSHESFWYACYTQTYQKGKVWRLECFYSIYNSFPLQPMRKFLLILLMD